MKRPKLPARRPPQLLALVYLISILLVVVTAIALSTVVGDGISNTAVNASLAADRALVTAFVQSNMTPEEVTSGVLASDRVTKLGDAMQALADTGIVRIKMYRPDGTVLLSNDPTIIGQQFKLEDDIVAALGGTANGDVTDTRSPTTEPDLPRLGIPLLLEEYLPVTVNGTTQAVFEVYRDADAGPGAELADARAGPDRHADRIGRAGGLPLLRLPFRGSAPEAPDASADGGHAARCAHGNAQPRRGGGGPDPAP